MSLDLGRTLVFVNPVAGGGRAGRSWARLAAAVPELRAARLVRAADADGARRELEERLAQEDLAAVIAFGGDGTAHLVADRLLASGRAGEVAFGLIPAGTGSDLARLLGLPRRPAEVLRRLMEATPRKVDALLVEADDGRREHVINIASAGLSGVVDQLVNAVPDRGPLTFLLSTLRGLWSYAPAPCRVVVDGEEVVDGGFFLLAVANGQYFGKGMRVAPRAVLDDGLADVVLIPPVPRWQLPYRLPQFLTGRHIDLPIVTFRRATTVRLEPRGPFPPFDVDGETLASGPSTVRVLAGALRLLA